MFLYVSLQILVNSVSPNRPAVLYEKVAVSEGGSPLLRDMLFSPDQQYIYTLTDRQVRSLLEMHRHANGMLIPCHLQEPNDMESAFLKFLQTQAGCFQHSLATVYSTLQHSSVLVPVSAFLWVE